MGRFEPVLEPVGDRRHFADRRPRGQRVSWARFKLHGRITYRLFRRDLTGKLFLEAKSFDYREPRSHIAATVWQMRIRLRETVDEVDFKHLGVLD